MVPHGAGIYVVLQAGNRPGLYAIEGVQIDYQVGSTRYRSKLYTGLTACLPKPGSSKCPDAWYQRVLDMASTDQSNQPA